MSEPIHLTLDQVLQIHAAVLEAHGGVGGVRDLALLESAVAAPRATFGGEPLISDPVEIAAAYLFYICRNHPFLDGNKRASLAACLMFLRLNRITARPDGPEWESLVLDVAASQLDRAQTAARLRRLVSVARTRTSPNSRKPARHQS